MCKCVVHHVMIVTDLLPDLNKQFEKYQAQKKEDDDDSSDDPNAEHVGQLGCAPYLQIFKAGKLVFTTAASKSFNQGKEDLPFCFPFETSITFPVETVVQGDILIRCRHLTRKGQRVSMFRAAMHTGYIPPKVLRLRKSEIDGACSDKRYADDFFIDLVFEECSASMASKHLLSSPEKGGEDEHEITFSRDSKGDEHNEASVRRMAGTVAGAEGTGAVTVTASAYDSMLHRDSRFWDVITQRRDEKSKPTTTSTDPNSEEKVLRAFYGPTIGRRREFPDEAASSKASKDGTDSCQRSVASQKSALQAFTIGGELDFTLDDDKKSDSGDVAKASSSNSSATSSSSEKKDDLMDALMAIDDDDDEAHDEVEDEIKVEGSSSSTLTEEIVFDNTAGASDNNSEEDVAKTKEVDASEEDATPSEVKPEENNADTSETDGLMNLDDLNLDDIDNDANVADAGDDDDFDFSDGDDDELADLEQFLMKATN